MNVVLLSIIGRGAQFILFALVAQSSDIQEFGRFAAAMGLGGLLAAVLPFGSNAAATRYLLCKDKEGQDAIDYRFVAFSVCVIGALGLLLCIFGATFAYVFRTDIALFWQAISLGIPMAYSRLFRRHLVILGKASRGVLIDEVCAYGCVLAFVFAFPDAVKENLALLGPIWGIAAISLFLSLIQGNLSLSNECAHWHDQFFRWILSSLYCLFSEGTKLFNDRFDIIIILPVLGFVAFSNFTVALKLFMVLVLLQTAYLSYRTQRLVLLSRRHSKLSMFRSSYQRIVLETYAIIAIPAIVYLFFGSELILLFFGNSFIDGGVILQFLTLGLVISIPSFPLQILLIARGHEKELAFFGVVFVILGGGVSALVMLAFGLVTGVGAYILSVLLYRVIVALYAKRVL